MPGPIVTSSSAWRRGRDVRRRRSSRPAGACPPSSSGRRSGSARRRSPGSPCRGRRRRRRRWGLAAELELDRDQPAGARLGDLAPVAAEPTNVTWSTPACSASASPVPVAGGDLDHPARHARVLGELGEAQRRDRGQLGRLDDHRVARRERGRGAAGGDLERVVQGDDLRAHAPRLAHRVVQDVRAERDLAAFEALDRARVVVEVADGGGDVGLGLLERLAGVAGLELGQRSFFGLDPPRPSRVSACARISGCATRARPRARGGRPRPSRATCSALVSGSSANSCPVAGRPP